MATECPGRPSAQGPEINSNQTEGWSQAIAARPVELEKEIWFKKDLTKNMGQILESLQNLTQNLFKIFF